MSDDPRPTEPGDERARAAFDNLKAQSNRLDLVSARRRITEGDSRSRSFAPAVALAVLVLGAFVGVGLLVGRDGPTRIETDRADEAVAIADGEGGADGDEPDEIDLGIESATAASLDGTSWRLTSGVDLVPGAPITLNFADDRISGSSACNGYGARFTIDGSAFTVEQAGGTDVLCDQPVMAAETAFLDALAKVRSISLDGDRLVLDGDTVLTFEPVGAPDVEAVVGVTWILNALTEGDTTVEAVGGHLRLDGGLDGGELEGSTGCRELAGEWIVVGGDIVFTSWGAEGECSAQLSTQDSQVIAGFEGGFTPTITDDRLIVDSGEVTLEFRRAEPGENTPEITAEDRVGFDFDPTLTWSVIHVQADDVLNVRAEPGAGSELVGELAPGETGITAGVETVVIDGGRWRKVHTASIPEGWVNERFLTAQPTATESGDELIEATQRLIDGAPLASVAGDTVWFAGIGVYADFPFPPMAVDSSRWTEIVDFTPEEISVIGDECSECLITPREFAQLPEPNTEYNLIVDHLLTSDDISGGFTFNNGPVENLVAVHHVTIDVPATDDIVIDWRRIHLFFDWRTGTPLLHTIFAWGWTP